MGNQNTYIPQKVPYYLKYIVRIKIVIVNINIPKTTGSKVLLHVQLQRGASQPWPPESFVRLTIIITVNSYVMSKNMLLAPVLDYPGPEAGIR